MPDNKNSKFRITKKWPWSPAVWKEFEYDPFYGSVRILIPEFVDRNNDVHYSDYGVFTLEELSEYVTEIK